MYPVSWSDVYRLTLTLSRSITPENVDVIVGILRGGACISSILSDIINKDVITIRVKSYSGTSKTGKPVVTSPPCADLKDKRVLVVDDVCDTSETLKVVKEFLKMMGVRSIITATLFIKRTCEEKPDLWVKEVNDWILFPWEVFEVMKSNPEGVKPLLPRVLGEEVAKAVLGESKETE